MHCQYLPRAAVLLLGGITFACQTPEEYRKDADAEVYALVDARRATLFAEGSGFTIEPPPDSLRQRILRGDWDSEHVFTLVDVLEVAAENNRELQTSKESLYRAALGLTLERWQFGWRPGGTANGSLTGGAEAESASLDGGLSMTKLLGSGASIVTDIGAGVFRAVSTGDGWDVVSDIGLSVTQPLMRGAGQRIVKENLTQSERDLVYEVRSYERFRRTFAVDVAGRVYSLLRTVDELANEERNYENLVELRERNVAMAEAGRLSGIQADQAKQDELGSETTLLRLRASLERQRDQFNLFLGLPIETRLRLDPREFSSLSDSDPLLEMIDPGAAIGYALTARLDQQTTLDTVADRARKVSIAEDALRAGLSLSASASQFSDEGRPLDLSQSGLDWSLGLSFDAPLDRRAERNAYRSSLISLVAAERSAEAAADGIRADVRDALRQAENSRKDFTIQRGAVELSHRRVESAMLNLDAGRASTRDVLDSQESLVNAENAATAALITFTLARLELYLQLELLRVDDDGLHVEEELTRGLLEGTR
jgi:outer membrane protein TolC